MTYWKIVEDHKHLGVLVGDSATFRATTTPHFDLPAGFLTWGGLAQGNTSEVTVSFTAPNTPMAPVTVTAGGVALSANVAIRHKPTGDGEKMFVAKNFSDAYKLYKKNILAAPMTSSEAWVWTMAAYPGNQINTKADAARHAYWTCLMTRYVDELFAQGLSAAHEVSAPGQANETVMDMYNNMKGRAIAYDHVHVAGQQGVSDFQCCRDAVQNAINDGRLWYMDDPTNEEKRGLLLPTDE